MDKIRLAAGVADEHYLPEEFTGMKSCPHCQTRRPGLRKTYTPKGGLFSHVVGDTIHWAIHVCSTCSLTVSIVHRKARYLGGGDRYDHEYGAFPVRWSPDEMIPDKPRRFLSQAYDALSTPDASVVMSASAIASMLKYKGLTENSLFARIDEAVKKGLLTACMSEWAHLVRLNSNSPRHADESAPHMTENDARLSFEFAKAIAEVLFGLPSKMPSRKEEP